MAARVSISIVNRSYEIACDEGQEQEVLQLAAEVDQRAGELLQQVGQVGDARLLAMVAIQMVDELKEARQRKGLSQPKTEEIEALHRRAQSADKLTEEIEALRQRVQSADALEQEVEDLRRKAESFDPAQDSRLAQAIEAMAHRIEAMAERLEAARDEPAANFGDSDLPEEEDKIDESDSPRAVADVSEKGEKTAERFPQDPQQDKISRSPGFNF